MKNRTSSLKIGIGTPTTLMVFVVLCMVILSVLSYMEANTNSNLSEKELLYTEQYYKANTQAELIYHTLNQEINQSDDPLIKVKELYNVVIQEKDTELEYYVTINEKKILHVAVNKYNLSTIHMWKVISKEEM
ncbi:MAG: hypothetical protein PHQ89_03410 [Bacilli bacterium]|nr:hypothetical protein [Bacilli bacterium]